MKHSKGPRGRLRLGNRRGSAMVETALILIPFLTVLFAIIDFNVYMFVRNTLQHSVREGVRYAVTYQTAQGMGHDASIKSVVQSNAMGLLAGTSNLSKVSIKYFRQSDLAEVSGNLPGNMIEVAVNDYRWPWISQWFALGQSASIYVSAGDRMEALPTGSIAPTR